MLPQEIIRKKRDGGVLSAAEISEFIAGLTTGATSDAQAAAFAMAVLLRKMTLEERVALTEAMRDSGQVMRWDLPGPVVDKHSTGGGWRQCQPDTCARTGGLRRLCADDFRARLGAYRRYAGQV